jgi:hypothetical protein
MEHFYLTLTCRIKFVRESPLIRVERMELGDGASDISGFRNGDVWLDINGNGVLNARTDRYFAWIGEQNF